MGQFLVITFGERETAGQAAERLKGVQAVQRASISDMAVVEKDADGKVKVHHGIDTTTAGGAWIGGALGLLLGLVFFPLAGLAIGAVAGGIIGRSLSRYVDRDLVKDVTDDLTPDTSALFVIGTGRPGAVVGALEPFRGKVYQTTLDAEAEEQIERALEKQRQS